MNTDILLIDLCAADVESHTVPTSPQVDQTTVPSTPDFDSIIRPA